MKRVLLVVELAVDADGCRSFASRRREARRVASADGVVCCVLGGSEKLWIFP